MMNDNEAFNKLAEDDGISIKGLTPTDMLLVYEGMIAEGEAYFDPVSNSVKLTELGKLEIWRSQVLDHNVKKLSKRYDKGYSNEAAINRADKEPGQ